MARDHQAAFRLSRVETRFPRYLPLFERIRADLFVDEAKQDTLVKQLREAHQERIWSLWIPMNGLIILNLFALNIGEPEETLGRTLTLEGVKHGIIVIFKELIAPERPNWMDELIEKKIAESGA